MCLYGTRSSDCFLSGLLCKEACAECTECTVVAGKALYLLSLIYLSLMSSGWQGTSNSPWLGIRSFNLISSGMRDIALLWCFVFIINAEHSVVSMAGQTRNSM